MRCSGGWAGWCGVGLVLLGIAGGPVPARGGERAGGSAPVALRLMRVSREAARVAPAASEPKKLSRGKRLPRLLGHENRNYRWNGDPWPARR